MSILADSHDQCCGCNWPFAHLLASIFPPGHTDRDLTINQILNRDYKELCLSGGHAERNIGEGEEDHGTGEEELLIKEEKDTIEENLEEAIAAVESAEAR